MPLASSPPWLWGCLFPHVLLSFPTSGLCVLLSLYYFTLQISKDAQAQPLTPFFAVCVQSTGAHVQFMVLNSTVTDSQTQPLAWLPPLAPIPSGCICMTGSIQKARLSRPCAQPSPPSALYFFFLVLAVYANMWWKFLSQNQHAIL